MTFSNTSSLENHVFFLLFREGGVFDFDRLDPPSVPLSCYRIYCSNAPILRCLPLRPNQRLKIASMFCPSEPPFAAQVWMPTHNLISMTPYITTYVQHEG
jgi:hypothetical protein